MSDHLSLREALRVATLPEHRRLESHPLMQRLLHPELTLVEYGHILRAQRAFYRQLEPTLASLELTLRECLPEVGYQYQPRLPSLNADCQYLQLPADEVHDREKNNDGCTDPARFTPRSPQEALGVLYVFEGSSRGGRIIARALNRSLGLTDHGAGFYRRYAIPSGPGVEDDWTRLCRWLEMLPSQSGWEQALIGASGAFNGLYAQLDEWQRLMSDR